MAPPVIFSGFSFVYKGATHPALQIEHLEIAAGEFCCLIGANGAGKTTFCRALCGLIPHFYPGELRGSLRIGGEETSTKAIHELVMTVGYVMDDPFEQLTRATETVYEEIAFGLQNAGLPPAEIHKRVDETIAEMEIKELAKREPTRLSNGEQQRTVLAAILAQRPDVLVMDEATSQLDPAGAAAIYQIASRLKAKGKTVILVEPRLDSALEFADKLLLLEDGCLIASGSPAEILMEGHLEKMNLGVPSYALLAKELAARGAVRDQTPIHLEQARQMIEEALHGAD